VVWASSTFFHYTDPARKRKHDTSGLPKIHMPIFTPVQAPDSSQANPYACAGSLKC
ncbi:hypothetical protein O181_127678, partial [Austropuccinia psidii MF-1]|nr:hypothetical protein [Austropuccinia psidii MF-1]